MDKKLKWSIAIAIIIGGIMALNFGNFFDGSPLSQNPEDNDAWLAQGNQYIPDKQNPTIIRDASASDSVSGSNSITMDMKVKAPEDGTYLIIYNGELTTELENSILTEVTKAEIQLLKNNLNFFSYNLGFQDDSRTSSDLLKVTSPVGITNVLTLEKGDEIEIGLKNPISGVSNQKSEAINNQLIIMRID